MGGGLGRKEKIHGLKGKNLGNLLRGTGQLSSGENGYQGSENDQ